jgi:putative colanic acid biosynthesis UDP-glucose lipid carrier transferase
LKLERVRLYFFGYFSDKVSNLEVTGSIKDIKSFVIENAIDDVYCSLDEVSNEQLKGANNLQTKTIKQLSLFLILRNFDQEFKIDYYDFFPVLSLHKTS